MQMEDILPGCFAIGLEQVDTVILDTAGADGFAYAHHSAEYMHTGWFISLEEICKMLFGDYDNLAGIQSVDVHEGKGGVVLVNEAGRDFTLDDIAKNTIIRQKCDLPDLGSAGGAAAAAATGTGVAARAGYGLGHAADACAHSGKQGHLALGGLVALRAFSAFTGLA